MRLPLLACAAAIVGLGALPSAADPATADGAKAIAATYAAYFGPEVIARGVVSVTPDGDDYVVSWDLGKAIAALDAPAPVEVAPLVYRITPTLDGGWLARAASLPSLSVGPTGEDGRGRAKAAFEGFRFDGLFDATAAEFWRSKLSLGAFKLDMNAKSAAEWRHVALSEDGIAGELRIKAGAAPDSVDVRMTQSMTSAGQTTSVVGEDGAETGASETRQGPAAGDGSVSNFRAKAFGELWRFLVAHADSGPPSGEELKPKLAALMPLWEELSGQFHLDDVALSFPGGSVRAKSAGEEVRITGLVEKSSASMAFALKDLTLDFEAAPDWAKSLWPISFECQVAAGVDGLDHAVRLALDDADFLKSGRLSDDAKAQISETLVAGRPRAALSETRVITPLGDATLEGETTWGEGGPKAQAKVTSSDLDKLMQMLAQVGETQPNARQWLYVVTFVRGLAQSEDGRLVWNIEYARDEIRVNGQLLSPK